MIADSIRRYIQELLQQNIQFTPIGGGSINDTYRIDAGKERFFCKINSHSKFPGLFESERQGLELLRAQNVIRVPAIIGSAVAEDSQVLVLEWIDQGMRSADFWKLFGQQLAELHSVQEKSFGLEADNYMGALVQRNQPHADWNEFFIHRRLMPQLKLALDAGLLTPQEAKQFENLYQKLPGIFPAIPPGLLHGDLWSGNFLCDDKGQPVLIDPAVYYGHPAIDLAMTTLFGGFEKAFYESYNHFVPFPPNYPEQWEVCNLYPLLIHLNLFGESYKSSILHTIRRY